MKSLTIVGIVIATAVMLPSRTTVTAVETKTNDHVLRTSERAVRYLQPPVVVIETLSPNETSNGTIPIMEPSEYTPPDAPMIYIVLFVIAVISIPTYFCCFILAAVVGIVPQTESLKCEGLEEKSDCTPDLKSHRCPPMVVKGNRVRAITKNDSDEDVWSQIEKDRDDY